MYDPKHTYRLTSMHTLTTQHRLEFTYKHTNTHTHTHTHPGIYTVHLHSHMVAFILSNP